MKNDDLPSRNLPAPGIGATIWKGGCGLGLIGFLGGFIGPIIFAPEANQGPMLGIFFTGPLGFVLGIIGGAIVGTIRSRRRER